MKHKTWFRLALKAIGVFVFVNGASSILRFSAYYWVMIASGGLGSVDIEAYFQFAGPMFQIAAGLYLFFGGEWVVNKAIPSNRPYCHECGYDLSGAASNRCPECDTPIDPESVRPSALAMAGDDVDGESDRDGLA